MNKYNNSKIYKIWSSSNPEEIYIGSTIKSLKDRYSAHKSDYKKWLENKRGFYSSFSLFEKYGVDTCFIELIETHNCNNADELKKREGHFQAQIKCINKCRAGTGHYNKERNKDYYRKNREVILQKQKAYKELNKDKIRERESIKKECPHCKVLFHPSSINKHIRRKHS